MKLKHGGATWGRALALSGQFKNALEWLGKRAPRDTVGDRVDAVVCQAWCEDMLGRPGTSDTPVAEALARRSDLPEEHRAVLLGARMAGSLRAGAQVSAADSATVDGLLGSVPSVTRGWLSAVLATAALGQPHGEPMSAAVQATHAALLLDEAADEAIAGQLDALVWLAEAELGLDRTGAAERHALRGLTIAQERGFHAHSVILADILARHSEMIGDTGSATKYADVAEVAAAETDSDHLAGLAERTRPAAEAGDAGPGEEEKSLDALSRREEQIAVLISQGCTNQRIARALCISQKTVETHLGRIFRKLTVSSRAEVAFVVGRSGAVALRR
ncbi:LuxR C-terminal-related transcriptional regulator [Lentzea sp. NPDC060358]|uniref:helix-turn-helix transcriptional regulator n=1 Tax=Lentzea sp. NPDC060358 TaxID=3347103 RepID=UPI00365DBB65